ncbi:hypothetical protein CPHO_07930 [Corynebacterium phocae]|uniref:Secreted protein n=1 Tax=Corynebacterium phocae TaxID=161895 RepID=A0A1L7D3V7_9CORY|nr:hypothetical protein [Corynebacterium phocae]APT92829.1 hypothetical protein CPHO_07930 [Corynebacterium phocae]
MKNSPSRTHARLTASALACALGMGLIPGPTSAVAQAPDFLSTLSSLGAGGPASPLDEFGRPTPATQEQVRAFALSPWIPEELRNAILTALEFTAGTGQAGGPPLIEGGPIINQFAWPTVSANCIGGQLDSVGSGIAVAGPTEIPAPGAGPGEVAFLFTALGTAAAAPQQGEMNVQWFNISNFTSGTTPLFYHGINPDGPTTVSGRAATGPGTVVAILSGAVNTQEAHCAYAPTALIMEVR